MEYSENKFWFYIFTQHDHGESDLQTHHPTKPGSYTKEPDSATKFISALADVGLLSGLELVETEIKGKNCMSQHDAAPDTNVNHLSGTIFQ